MKKKKKSIEKDKNTHKCEQFVKIVQKKDIRVMLLCRFFKESGFLLLLCRKTKRSSNSFTTLVAQGFRYEGKGSCFMSLGA